MAEIGRNTNKAFDAGRDAHDDGARYDANPYKARFARRAWAAGYRKAAQERASIILLMASSPVTSNPTQRETT
jgi:ribosome modulation factor